MVLLRGCTPCFCEHYLFTEVMGQVTINDKPVIGAQVVQISKSNAHEYSSTVKVETDDKGNFLLPAVAPFAWVEYWMEPIHPQKITINYQGKDYIAWEAEKRNYEQGGELKRKNQKQIALLCDLNAEDKNVEGRFITIGGICEITNN